MGDSNFGEKLKFALLFIDEIFFYSSLMSNSSKIIKKGTSHTHNEIFLALLLPFLSQIVLLSLSFTVSLSYSHSCTLAHLLSLVGLALQTQIEQRDSSSEEAVVTSKKKKKEKRNSQVALEKKKKKKYIKERRVNF